MKTALFTFALSLLALSGQAQTISGNITDRQGQPLPGANVLLKGTFSGATSDADGRFSFSAPDTGAYVLQVRFIGFQEVEKKIRLKDETAVTPFHIVLKPAARQLQEVMVSAGANRGPAALPEATRISTQEALTTAGALGDAVGALQYMPGTTTDPSDGRLFIRGGRAEELRMYVNGLPVASPYGAGASRVPARGRFSPMLFRGMQLNSGAYGAEYGDALSAVINLQNRPINKKNEWQLGLMSVGASASYEQAIGNGGVILAGEYTNLAPYLKLDKSNGSWQHAPESAGATLMAEQRFGKARSWAMADLRTSRLGVTLDDITEPTGRQEVSLKNTNLMSQLGLQHPLGDHWVATSGLTYHFDDSKQQANQHGRQAEQHMGHAKLKLEGDLAAGWQLNTGMEITHTQLNEQLENGAGGTVSFHHEYSQPAAWAELAFPLAPKLGLRTGVRAEGKDPAGKPAVLPRATFSYQLAERHELQLAYGQYRQRQQAMYLRENSALKNAQSTHAVMRYTGQWNKRSLQLEAYQKSYRKLVRTQPTLTTEGDGYARGIDLFWRDRETIKSTDYWVSYSLLFAERQELTDPVAAQPTYAARHSLSLVARHFIKDLRSQVGGSFQLRSGLPYDDPHTESFRAERSPLMQNLSLNWVFLWKPQWIIYASATNVLNKQAISGYRYAAQADDEGNFARQAITPVQPRFFFVGVFLTLNPKKSAEDLFNQI